MTLFSRPAELRKISSVLTKYMKLPFAQETVPGAIMESVLAHVRGAKVLNTYDFIDVLSVSLQVGWQVKSTKASTPVTWKRAKIEDKDRLIRASMRDDAACQELGNAILKFCNDHARESMEKYKLQEIGYSRLVVVDSGQAFYFERKLCDQDNKTIFDESEFEWHWSKQKVSDKKEQLSALHGIKISSGKRWWAWHGLGENQLHFTGERNWWPESGNPNRIDLVMPSEEEKITLTELIELISE